ncbi:MULTISPECIES: restriction endonuclease subunit S [Campylobacter]|uniref:restriction endonuclease subunit S n=1 Tax=Campylobacter TaxID=194 RepID=UPI001F21D12A|nr:restriction endonuclease subunit S [Campylobacter sp. P0024]
MFESSNGNFDIKKEHINGNGEYVITAGLSNNGILGKTDIKAKIFEPKTITIDMFGCAFYRQFQYKMVTHARVFSLKPSFEITDKQGMFLSCSLNFLRFLFGYENMCSWEKIKNHKIKLPITASGEIDFDFMESFIAELEAERVRELEAYLKASGLSDTTLSPDEKSALNTWNSRIWQEFKFKDIFNNIKQGRRVKKDDQIDGDIPFIMSGITNTGFVKNISNPIEIYPKNSITIDIFGNTFYRNYVYGAGDDTGIYWNDMKDYSKLVMLFFTTSMAKSVYGKFDFGKKLRSSQSLDFTMKLPITASGEIDFDFMENFIKAIQKLIIKDLVIWSQKKIEATKQVVGL